MEPEQRTFEQGDGNAVVLAVGLWAEHDGIHLRIDMAGVGAHTAVINRPGSARNHRILFRDLRKVLKDNGCWELSDQGAEDPATAD